MTSNVGLQAPYGVQLPEKAYARGRNRSGAPVGLGYVLALDVDDVDSEGWDQASFGRSQVEGPLSSATIPTAPLARGSIACVVTDLMDEGGVDDSWIMVQYQGYCLAYHGQTNATPFAQEIGAPLRLSGLGNFFDGDTTAVADYQVVAKFWDLSYTPSAQASTVITNATLKGVILTPWGCSTAA